MSEPIADYDPAAALETDEAISVFLDDALETGNAAYIENAIEIAARAKSMIAAKSAVR
jgi:probable addiction module antidote protein